MKYKNSTHFFKLKKSFIMKSNYLIWHFPVLQNHDFNYSIKISKSFGNYATLLRFFGLWPLEEESTRRKRYFYLVISNLAILSLVLVAIQVALELFLCSLPLHQFMFNFLILYRNISTAYVMISLKMRKKSIQRLVRLFEVVNAPYELQKGVKKFQNRIQKSSKSIYLFYFVLFISVFPNWVIFPHLLKHLTLERNNPPRSVNCSMDALKIFMVRFISPDRSNMKITLSNVQQWLAKFN